MQLEEMNLDLEEVRIPVAVGGKWYVLLEASEDQNRQFKNTAMKSYRLSADSAGGRIASVDGIADLQSLLVSFCLHEVWRLGADKKEERIPSTVRPENWGEVILRPVSLSFVRGLRTRIVKPLFERAKDISEIHEDGLNTVEAIDRAIAELQKRRSLLEAELPKGERNGTQDTTEQPIPLGGRSESTSVGAPG